MSTRDISEPDFLAGRPCLYTDLSGVERIAIYSRNFGGPGGLLPPRLTIVANVERENPKAQRQTFTMGESEALSFFANLPDARRLPS